MPKVAARDRVDRPVDCRSPAPTIWPIIQYAERERRRETSRPPRSTPVAVWPRSVRRSPRAASTPHHADRPGRRLRPARRNSDTASPSDALVCSADPFAARQGAHDLRPIVGDSASRRRPPNRPARNRRAPCRPVDQRERMPVCSASCRTRSCSAALRPPVICAARSSRDQEGRIPQPSIDCVAQLSACQRETSAPNTIAAARFSPAEAASNFQNTREESIVAATCQSFRGQKRPLSEYHDRAARAAAERSCAHLLASSSVGGERAAAALEKAVDRNGAARQSALDGGAVRSAPWPVSNPMANRACCHAAWGGAILSCDRRRHQVRSSVQILAGSVGCPSTGNSSIGLASARRPRQSCGISPQPTTGARDEA